MLFALFVNVLVAGSSARAQDGSTLSPYTIHQFEQKLDHFDQNGKTTWSQRYLTNTDNWDGRGKLPNGCKGPILLYTGNEGPITEFWPGNGFMIDVLAPKFGAYVLFPEARYFGTSLPFGNRSFSDNNVAYLSTEQILADYVDIVLTLKKTIPGLENCPVVAFGGSYGGTLTTLIRASYPEVIVGGLAASAPIGYYDPNAWLSHGVTEFTWASIVARDYIEADPYCITAIQATVDILDSSTKADLVKAFGLCEKAGLGPNTNSDLFLYVLENTPQLDYPYAIGNLPAWPVNATCRTLVQGYHSTNRNVSLLEAAVNITRTSMATGDDCIPTETEGPGEIPGDGPGDRSAWAYLSCTETVHLFSSKKKGLMGIRDYQFSMNSSAWVPCANAWGQDVYPNPNHLTQRYGGYTLSEDNLISNIIWSNGGLDPWHGGGFYPTGTPAEEHKHKGYTREGDKHYIWMAKGAHHLDLRGPHPEDPKEVTAARQFSESIIAGWIKQAGQA